MKYQGNGKYTIKIKNEEIRDVTIVDIRALFSSFDNNIAKELMFYYKKKYAIDEYSIYDITTILEGKEKFIGNLNTKIVQDTYRVLNQNNTISKKKAAKLIAKRFDKSIKTIEKHLYKKI